MTWKFFLIWIRRAGLAAMLAAAAWAGTFGTVVPIGGHASDLALDEARGVLYIANFTANRIEVLTLADGAIRSSMNVAPQPGALALSPDGQFLLVAHFGNFAAPGSPANALSVMNLRDNTKQTFALGFPPLGVAFGIDDRALVVTTNDFLRFDPVSGQTEVLDTIGGVTARTLPVPPANFPPQIIAASVTAAADGLRIYGLTDTIRFSYDVLTRRVVSLGYTASPPLGPRVVSVSRTGNYYAAGWGLFDPRGILLAQFNNPSGLLNVGSHAIDSSAGVIYAQIPEGSPQANSPIIPASPPAAPTPLGPPVLSIVDADNLAVRERLQLAENLAGRSVLNSAGDVLYAVSESGVTVLPVGALGQAHRLAANQEDLIFRGNFCDRRVITQELTIVDPGGGNTDFTLAATIDGVTISPASGMTPATVQVRVDPAEYQGQKGTVTGYVQIRSSRGVNLPDPVRLLVNNREPDQRGTFVNIPGRLTDLLADPVRDRFYVVRQDRNQVLVFEGSTYQQIATLRTSNTPMGLAITFDRKHLLIGHDNSQLAYVYDLDTLEQRMPIHFPAGHYPRSLAASGDTILAASRVAGPVHTIDRVNFNARSATTLPTLGIYRNEVDVNTVLTASPNGSSILVAQADGNLLLYNANAGTFTISRRDFAALSGAYAASSFDQFVVDNNLLNASLVPLRKLESGTGASSGFVFVDQGAFRSTAAAASSPGVMQRVDVSRGESVRPTRMVEAPPVRSGNQAGFTRTLAALYSRSGLISLSTSGFTVLPWNYDAAVAAPRIERVVNAADRTHPVAPGGLIMVTGSDMSVVNIATRELPLPTALGESCLTVNGVPSPMLLVSSSQINAQLPFNVDGNSTMVLRTPGGVSDNFNFTILPAAPSIFHSGTAGPQSGLPTVVRAGNGELVTPTNPIHPDDQILIYATGLGRTSPSVEAGIPAPSDPLPLVLIEPQVTLGGVSLPLSYAGLAPGQVGVYQINAAVPFGVPLGMSVPLTISQGGSSTTLAVRVVK
jgi:uncharacterized protein (TIGR03437 family)